MLLGILYIAFGVVIVGQPVASALILTYVLGLALLLSGVIRILLGVSHWKEAGWIMLLSGLFGILAGLVILTDSRRQGSGCSAFSSASTCSPTVWGG